MEGWEDGWEDGWEEGTVDEGRGGCKERGRAEKSHL